ncbi:MAG TPA: hypothetical protein VNZ61_08665 [Roseomonas sp.]|nr:hypothetical protein [Roseomonas sp.]
MARILKQRLRWVWQQDSAWADATCILALAIWTVIDLTGSAGVTDRSMFSRINPPITDLMMTSFTATLTCGHVVALMVRRVSWRLPAAFLQGVFWLSVSILVLTPPTGPIPYLSSASIAMWLMSWFSLIRVTRRYTLGGE